MYKYLVTTLTLIFCNILPTNLSAGGRWQEAIHESVAKVRVFSPGNKELYTGSGFAISNDRLLTAAHVCEGLQKGGTIGITENGRIIGFRVLKQNRNADLCILQGRHKLKPLKIAPTEPKQGGTAYTFGYPLGVGAFLTKGSYGALGEINGNLRRFLSVRACGGNSGGPVLNWRGEVTGVLIEGIVEGMFSQCSHMSFSPTFASLREFLRK